MHVSKRGDKYETVLPNEDLNEISDLSLDELLAWVNYLRDAHGGDARFELSIYGYGDGEAEKNYTIRRGATPEEIAAYQLKQAADAEAERKRKLAEYEKLRAEFEPKA